MVLYSDMEELDTMTLESDIYSITAVTGNTAVVQLSDGCLVTAAVTAEGQLEVEDTGTKWPAVCSTVMVSDHGILGLTDRFQLYLDNKQLGTNVTSIQLHSSFLLMTTLDHQLVTLQLDQLLDSAATAAKRRVERGSRLVVKYFPLMLNIFYSGWWSVFIRTARLSSRCPGGTLRSFILDL